MKSNLSTEKREKSPRKGQTCCRGDLSLYNMVKRLKNSTGHTGRRRLSSRCCKVKRPRGFQLKSRCRRQTKVGIGKRITETRSPWSWRMRAAQGTAVHRDYSDAFRCPRDTCWIHSSRSAQALIHLFRNQRRLRHLWGAMETVLLSWFLFSGTQNLGERIRGKVSPFFAFVKLPAWAAAYEAKRRWKTRLVADHKDTWSSTRTHLKVPHCCFSRRFPCPFQQHQLLVAVRNRTQGDGPSAFGSDCHSNLAGPDRRNSARVQRKARRTVSQRRFPSPAALATCTDTFWICKQRKFDLRVLERASKIYGALQVIHFFMASFFWP